MCLVWDPGCGSCRDLDLGEAHTQHMADLVSGANDTDSAVADVETVGAGARRRVPIKQWNCF